MLSNFSSYDSVQTNKNQPNSTIKDLDALDDLLRNYDRRALPTSHLGEYGNDLESRSPLQANSVLGNGGSTMKYRRRMAESNDLNDSMTRSTGHVQLLPVGSAENR